MSQRKLEAPVADGHSEDDIAEYLLSHPDFFERHDKLLIRLKLPHATGRAAVSLVERQVAVLRNRNDQLERRLKDLVAVAKLNDTLVEKIHGLAMNLVSVSDMNRRLELIETALREDFSADRAALNRYRETFGAAASRFPADDDDFRLQASRELVSVRELRSGADWSLKVRSDMRDTHGASVSNARRAAGAAEGERCRPR